MLGGRINGGGQVWDEIVFDLFSETIALFGLAGDDAFEDDEDVLDGVLADEELADGVGEFVEAGAVVALQVADFLQDADELVRHLVLVLHVRQQVLVLGLDVGVELVAVLHQPIYNNLIHHRFSINPLSRGAPAGSSSAPPS